MNVVYSTKDKENLLIDENLGSEKLSALAFMYNSNDGTINVKLVQNDDEVYYFHLDSFKAMQAIAQFLCDRLHESMKLIESGKLKYGDNIVDNDEIVKLLLNMPQGDAKHRS